MMPLTENARAMPHRPSQRALRPAGLREIALISVLAGVLGLATAVLLPPDLVPGRADDVTTSDPRR